MTTSANTAGTNGGVNGPVHPLFCNCPICRGLNREDRGKGDTGSLGKPSYTPEQAGAQITRTDRTWNGVGVLGQPATVTYSFRDTAPEIDVGVTGYNPFTASQIAQTELALAAWSDVANINFVRVKDEGSQYSDNGQIRLVNYDDGNAAAAAFAILPNTIDASDPDSQYNGDLWVNNSLDYNADPKLGNYGRLVLVHELGHTIGLSHPSDYNAGAGDPSYASADYAEDTQQYSVMSYWGERNTGALFGGLYPAAPMLDDIVAAQRLYGANMTTRTGNSVYGFDSNTGRDWLTATANTPVIAAIWDAGGTDTLNFSGYTVAQVIDLGQGNFSSTGGLTGNVAIAIGTVIENAIGGTGTDRIVGNASNNLLNGNGGADVVYGLAGADRLIAGAGGAPVIRAIHDTDRSSQAKALSLDAVFNTSANGDIGKATSVAHASVIADANGTNEYYSFTAKAGQTITLDIDRGTFDSFVVLYDADGKRLASNDDNDVVDAGSTGYLYDVGVTKAFDSYLTYTAKTSGTFYVEVRGIFGGKPVSATPNFGSYQLNVSVSGHALVAGPVGSLLDGGADNDVLVSGSAGDILNGGAGVDTASYETATRGVTVGLGIAGVQDTVGGGQDTLIDVERLIGSRFADTLASSATFASRIDGGAGDDTLLSGAFGDKLIGDGGDDTVSYAGATRGVQVTLAKTWLQDTRGGGKDILIGIENLAGSAYADRLTGNTGANRLAGGAGNDVLNGGDGADTLTGGAGADQFAFTTTLGSANIDTVSDFTAADDTILLGASVFQGLSAGPLASGAFYTGAAAHDGDDRIIYNSDTGALLFDRDGKGGAAAVQFAKIGTGLTLTSGDFIVG